MTSSSCRSMSGIIPTLRVKGQRSWSQQLVDCQCFVASQACSTRRPFWTRTSTSLFATIATLTVNDLQHGLRRKWVLDSPGARRGRRGSARSTWATGWAPSWCTTARPLTSRRGTLLSASLTSGASTSISMTAVCGCVFIFGLRANRGHLQTRHLPTTTCASSATLFRCTSGTRHPLRASRRAGLQTLRTLRFTSTQDAGCRTLWVWT
mmetsp:Transcript_36228/g.79627  ORF Transcript_36228/g.79627 Transcript_36228/m.79627 type:complete len:208 (-) Transcript_36228:40-663(-)